MGSARTILTWAALAAAVLVPVAAAATSEQLAWRHPVYIAAGFAGIAGLCLQLVQPLAIGGHLPGLSPLSSRRLHRWIGGLLVAAIAVHVGALWITSPPDVVDALLLRSPTPFSLWGVLAMWATLSAALLAAFRRPLRLRPRTWRIVHVTLAAMIVAGTLAHTLLIEGTMETFTKIGLCALVALATLKIIAGLSLRRGR